MTTLAIINGQTNVCENITLDDRQFFEVTLPNPYFALDLTATPSLHYEFNGENYVAVESVGQGGIGFTWDGTKLIQPQLK